MVRYPGDRHRRTITYVLIVYSAVGASRPLRAQHVRAIVGIVRCNSRLGTRTAAKHLR